MTPLDINAKLNAGGTFGQRVRYKMLQHGYTQRELGEKCGCTQAAIWRYIHDINLPEPRMLVALALTLDVSTDWLLGLSDKEERL